MLDLGLAERHSFTLASRLLLVAIGFPHEWNWNTDLILTNHSSNNKNQFCLSLVSKVSENGLIQPETRGSKSINYMWESIMSNDVSKAVEMRSDLHSNGVGDQVDRWFWSCDGEQIDGSASGWWECVGGLDNLKLTFHHYQSGTNKPVRPHEWCMSDE